MENKLYQLYLESPSGLSTAQRLHSVAKKHNLNVSLKKVAKVMETWDVATRLQKRYKKQSRMEKAIVTGPLHLFQIDLCIMPKYDRYVAILICVDCFSRMLYVRPVKSKKAEEIASKMREIFIEAGSPPNQINSDLGTEFKNYVFAALMKEFRIHHFFSNSFQKGNFHGSNLCHINKNPNLYSTIC